ncbi:predicted protein [Nematostella vectensis]|uniref:VWFA domain-containing protein n=1 Tax=Nematostella vectensis TaxID=45351 RepID=A7RJY1_NEMVE|nr:predicted protein [Nematostella vectensis]|eukprot:XP_001640228.1 predicted protein [Nematostella vectensis]
MDGYKYSSFVLLVAASVIYAQVKAAKTEHVKCDKKVDLAIVLDASASMGEDSYKLAKTLTKEIISRFTISPDKTRVSLNFFSANHVIMSKLSDNFSISKLFSLTDRMMYEKSFSILSTSLETVHFEVLAKKGGARPKQKGVKMAVVLVTDGFGTSGYEESIAQAKSLQNYHVEMFTVYPEKSRIYRKVMKHLASKPAKSHLFKLTKDGGARRKVVEKIVKQICLSNKYTF